MNEKHNHFSDRRKLLLAKCLLGLLWLTIIIFCLLHKDAFTLERILTYSPHQPVLAALALLALFAVKSLSIFLFCGVLYAASGILFPLPIAILLSIAGSAIMSSIPYWLGSQAAQLILARYPKAAYLHDLRSGNDFFFVLVVRLLGILPADVVSAYMGAAGVRCRDYLPACILGFLPSCILFPIMGMNISDVRSPQFLISLSIELAAMLSSCVVFHVCRKKNRHAQRNQGKKHD